MKEKKSNFWMGFVFGFAAVLVLGLCFYAGTLVAKHEDKKDTKTEEKAEKKDEKDETKAVELKATDKLVEEARKLVPMKMCHGYDIKLEGKSRTLDDLSTNEKLAMTAFYFGSNLSFENIDPDKYTGEVHEELKVEDVEKIFEDTSFLESLKKKGSYGVGPYSVLYQKGKYYYNLIATGCIAEEYKDDLLGFYKAVKEGNTLKVTYGYAYIDEHYDEKEDDFVSYLYKAKGDKEPLVKNPEINDETYLLEVDWSKFNQYEFVYDISDGNLRLQEINYIEVK